MDSVFNPYTPNAGASPEVLVGRDREIAAFDILLSRLERGMTSQSLIVTGKRGVGKTVLLNSLRKVAQRHKWEVIELELSRHGDPQFRKALASLFKASLLRLSPKVRWGERAKLAAGVLTSFSVTADTTGNWSLGWEFPAIEGQGDHGELNLDLTDVLIAIGEAAQDAGRGVVMLLDEIQFLDKTQFEALIQALHKTVQRELPVTLVGAGLPQIAELAGDAKSYAERLFKFPVIGSLSDTDSGEALRGPALAEQVVWDDDAIALAVDITQGYPYFLQELGHEAWEVADEATGTITREDVVTAKDAYEAKLDGSFFRVRLDRATPLQTSYMRAMAQLGSGPQKAAEVAELLGRESPQLGPVRAELISMGLLYTPTHGYAAFTVPDFDAFMLRAVPELVIPEVRVRKKR